MSKLNLRSDPVPVLSIWTPEDGILGAVAPLGLAAAAGGPALVVDLDPDGPLYPGPASLASLVAGGPRRDDLEPRFGDLAVLRNGGVGAAEANGVVTALVERWPFVVLRLGGRPRPEATGVPVVPVRVLIPGGLFPSESGPAVYQYSGWKVSVPQPAIVLPRPRPRTWSALAQGLRPVPDRWLRTWRRVWSMPWR